MDVFQAICDLREELRRIDSVIERLEALSSGKPTVLSRTGKVRSPRGRKSMDPGERAEVSVRMKAYWAKRRKEKQASKQMTRAAGLS